MFFNSRLLYKRHVDLSMDEMCRKKKSRDTVTLLDGLDIINQYSLQFVLGCVNDIRYLTIYKLENIIKLICFFLAK